MAEFINKTTIPSSKVLLILLIMFFNLGIAQISGGKLNQKDNLTKNISEENYPNKSELGKGVFHLKVEISNRSSGKVQLIEFGLNKSATIKPETVRATGIRGYTHFIELIGKKGKVIEKRSFGLFSESLPDKVGPDGNYVPTQPERKYYNEHVFNFKQNLSARKIKIYSGKNQIFSLNIPERICGNSQLKYCKINEISNKTVEAANTTNSAQKTNKDTNNLKKLLNTILNLF